MASNKVILASQVWDKDWFAGSGVGVFLVSACVRRAKKVGLGRERQLILWGMLELENPLRLFCLEERGLGIYKPSPPCYSVPGPGGCLWLRAMHGEQLNWELSAANIPSSRENGCSGSAGVTWAVRRTCRWVTLSSGTAFLRCHCRWPPAARLAGSLAPVTFLGSDSKSPSEDFDWLDLSHVPILNQL